MPQAEGLWQLSTQPGGTGDKERKEPRLSHDLLPWPSPGCFQRGSVGDVERDWRFLAGAALEREAAPELERSSSSHVLGRGAGRAGEFWEAAAFTPAGKSSGTVSTCSQVKRFSFFSLFSALSKSFSGMG